MILYTTPYTEGNTELYYTKKKKTNDHIHASKVAGKTCKFKSVYLLYTAKNYFKN